MRVLYCKNAVVPIDKIAAAYIHSPDRIISVLTVAGWKFDYAICFDEDTAGTQLDALARWLEADAPVDVEP